MQLQGAARRLTIFLGEEDRYDHKPLATEIGAGAGIEGFGASNHIHTTRILSLSNDLPIVVVIVDAGAFCSRSGPRQRWLGFSTTSRSCRPGRGLMLVAGIALAGAVGAPLRYLVDRFVQGRTDGLFPLGTFVVNVSGSFLLGIIAGLALYHSFPSTPTTILGSGFCGGYTTFSTFTYETLALAEDRAYGAALSNVLLSAVVPALAAGAGLALAAL